jgi:DNA-binding LytR/AlgR family response regulator
MGRRLTLGFIYDDKLTFHLLFFAIYIKCQDRTLDILYDYIIKDKGGRSMKVSVDISAEYKESYAVIYTDKVTEEIQRMLDIFSTSETPITALQNEENLIVLQPKEIYMVRVEDGDTIIYGENQKYRSRKRLYEIGQQLGKQFIQISKSTLINLSYMDSIEPGFSGTLLLQLKNGCKDYVSRTYLPEFKKYLGL